MGPVSEGECAALREALLSWYAAARRELPWRGSDVSPWAVWVSEIMLQQTRVESVIPYYHRFLARFPTPAALADAPLDEVLGHWQGLGYYSRARNLHRSAIEVVTRHNGEVPQDPAAFAALPGVGRYTAGAVGSIAFGHRLPVLDGNVERVLCRLDAIDSDPRRAPARDALWRRATEFADDPSAGDINQALIELGATVCTPRTPDCPRCPLREACKARANGDPESLPRKAKRPARPHHALVAALIQNDQTIWLAQRSTPGLLAGLWEPPGILLPGTPNGAPPEPDPQHLRELDLQAEGPPIATISHGFTHQKWTVTLYRATGTPRGGGYATHHAHPLTGEANPGSAQVPLSGPALKALRAAGLPLAHRRGAGDVNRASNARTLV